MAGFAKLALLEQLPPGSSLEVEHQGRIYALFNEGGTIRAIDGLCAHQGGPLAEGEVRDGCVTCPWHGWQYDLATGQSLLSARVRQDCFDVKVVGNDILVAIP
jgi:nitrite reductase/ring-hydroxylating ferredoxin subunit